MYIDDCKYNRNGKKYRRVLLRQGYRENGKVKHRTIANISHCSDIEIESMKIALKDKKELPFLKQLMTATCKNGKIIGSVFALFKVAKEKGILNFLKKMKHGKLILWLVFARLINQGSRLSAVRLANIHAGCEIIGID